MKLAFNEYYETVMKLALSWLRKYWKGYIILVLIVYGLMMAGFYAWWYSEEISKFFVSIKNKFTGKEAA